MSANDGQEFRLAQPHARRQLITAFGLGDDGAGSRRVSLRSMSRPAAKVAVGAPAGQYIVLTRSGVSIVVQAWKSGREALGHRRRRRLASAPRRKPPSTPAASTAAPPDWAFGLIELDWNTFTTPLAALAE